MNLIVFMYAHDKSSQSIMVDCAWRLIVMWMSNIYFYQLSRFL